MAIERIENINKDIIVWAIERSGISLEDFYAQSPNVKNWVEGNSYPTMRQLENFSNKVHVPFGYLFLNTPPIEEISFPFFRTGTRSSSRVSLNVYHTIQMLQDRQDWLVSYLEEMEFSDLDFVGKFNQNDNYLTIVNDIRNTLEIKDNWAESFSNWEEAFKFLTSKIEELGIIVTINGVVGGNTHRKINVEDCRGFVLVDKKAPFIFINNSDSKAAQMFTLMHEVAHIWIGESAGFINKNMLPANSPTEILSDQVAAEFLVPEQRFKEKWRIIKDNKELSKIFKVSPIVIGRRAMDLGLIRRTDFFNFYNTYTREWREKEDSKSGGGNYYNTTKMRLSHRFVSFVNNAVRENKLLYRDAYRLTGMKGDIYNKFIINYLY